MWDYTNYENQKKHLEAAGLNPALLYGSSGGGGGSAAGGGNAAGVGLPTSAGVGMGIQLEQMEAQKELANVALSPSEYPSSFLILSNPKPKTLSKSKIVANLSSSFASDFSISFTNANTPDIFRLFSNSFYPTALSSLLSTILSTVSLICEGILTFNDSFFISASDSNLDSNKAFAK